MPNAILRDALEALKSNLGPCPTCRTALGLTVQKVKGGIVMGTLCAKCGWTDLLARKSRK